MKDNRSFCDITFKEKLRIFSNDYLKCFNYIVGFDVTRYVFTKKLYSELVTRSQLIEDFLDFHGAKNSRDWYFYRELSAAVRHLSLASYAQKHISTRFAFYGLNDYKSFKKKGFAALDFFTQCLIKMAPVILVEAKRLEIPIPAESFDAADFPGIATSEMLEYDIDDDARDLQKRNIVKIASEFLSIADDFEQFSFFEPYSLKEIQNIVPEKINEVEIRRFEMLVHNLQSSFDSYVIHGGFRFRSGDKKLKQLRGHFSVVFHLLQMIGRLLHFYERHLHETSYKDTYKKVQEKLFKLIDRKKLLRYTVNYGLFYACHFLSTGKELAQEILNESVERTSISVNIPVKLGFHSRPSLLVAKIVQHFGGQVELVVGEDRFDASSVLDIQWAGGKIQKEKINEVVFEGDSRALKDIEILAKINYGEDTMGKGVPLPDELKYLR